MQSCVIDRNVQMPSLFKSMHVMSFIFNEEQFQLDLGRPSTLKHGLSGACQVG